MSAWRRLHTVAVKQEAGRVNNGGMTAPVDPSLLDYLPGALNGAHEIAMLVRLFAKAS